MGMSEINVVALLPMAKYFSEKVTHQNPNDQWSLESGVFFPTNMYGIRMVLILNL